MATVDLYCGSPANASDGAWYRSGNLYWYACVAATSDSQSMRTDNYYNYGDSRTLTTWGVGSVPTYITINSLTLWPYAGRTGTNAGSYAPYWNVGGGSFSAGTRVYPTGGWYSNTMARPGGGSWVRSELSGIGVKFYAYGDSGGGREIFVDCVLIRVDYSYITLASLTTNDATSVTSSGATISGSYNANGDGGTEWRMVYGTSTGSYDSPAWTADSGTGSITAPTRNLSGLSAGTTYYYRLEARNSADTAQYGSEKTFTTSAGTKGSRMMVMG